MNTSNTGLVGTALVRYINSGVTLGSVNLPEVSLRSLTLEEDNHARVIFIHHNVPGVLRKGMNIRCMVSRGLLTSDQSMKFLVTTTSISKSLIIREMYELFCVQGFLS
jgi:D-3-phosphoglycerate dehydrogenase